MEGKERRGGFLLSLFELIFITSLREQDITQQSAALLGLVYGAYLGAGNIVAYFRKGLGITWDGIKDSTQIGRDQSYQKISLQYKT
jgi:hypothetical protein